jgi:hypothetical protein
MKFLYPEFLYALFALAIPIIIHLFNFRKFKKVYYSDISLLKELKQETKSRARLKHWLILFMRLLAVACLVLAFAQPYVPADDQVIKAGNKVVSVYIDNSFSTDAKGANGYILQDEKEKALSIIESYGPSDRFQLVTNDFEGHLQRLYSKKEIIQLIEEVELSPVTRSLSEVVLRQRDILNNSDSPNKQAYLLSDYQKAISDFENIVPDTGISYRLLPFEQLNQSNFYIDSIWFKTPLRRSGDEETLFARVYNQSEKDAEIRLELNVNEKEQGFNTYIVPANNFTDCEFNYTIYTSGIQEATFLLADYPDPDITFDDKFFFSYHVADQIPMLIISDEITDTTKELGSILGSVPMFDLEFNKSNAINYSEFAKKNLIVLHGIQTISSGLNAELKNYISSGGNVFITPSVSADIESYNKLLLGVEAGSFSVIDTANNKVSDINLSHPIFSDIFERIPSNVDLPFAKSHYKLNISSRSKFEYLMRLQNGDAYLTTHDFDNGKIYLSSVSTDPSFGNFIKHGSVVASILRIGEFSQKNQKLYGVIGLDNSFSVKNKDYKAENIRIRGNQTEFIPQIISNRGLTDLQFHNQIVEAGNYQLINQSDHEYSFGWNYNRNESNILVLDKDEISSALKDNLLDGSFKLIETESLTGASNFNNLTDGEKYWKWFIILVLLFLGLEILIYRIFK